MKNIILVKKKSVGEYASQDIEHSSKDLEYTSQDL